ncbi:MAG: ATP-binding cassette domain-containing protein [Agathobacter sp.]|nr:ATP-binding cassette domain-containing protein [Agathobacter sp.]
MLVINNLTKIYKNRKQEKLALDNVSLELGDGVHALLGPNGAGKSTLMKLITCNLKSEDGQIKWKDKDGKEKEIEAMGAEYRSLIGYAPQQQGLYEAFTGYRFLQYMAVLKDIPKKQMDEEIKRVADSVNLSDVLDNRINAYSGGMKQRLLVAQALLGNPKLLIFDEPTVGLDPNERVRIREYIHAISKGKIVLIATHIVSDVESIADDVLIMKQGKIVEMDSTDKLCQKYATDKLEKVYIKVFTKQELE